MRRAPLLPLLACALFAAADEAGANADARTLLLGSLRGRIAAGTAFDAHIGPAPQRATVTASDADGITLRVDDATLTVPWGDLGAEDLHALAAAALPETAQKHALLGELAFQGGLVDLARADFARVVALGCKPPDDAGRLDARRIEVAHAQREANAEAAWNRLAPLLDDTRKTDHALAALDQFEAAYDGTRFIIGKRPAMAQYRAAARSDGRR